MAEIKFEFKGEHQVIMSGSKGWNLELNIVSWNDRDAKYDIRSWSEDHTKMGKGLTMTADELSALRDLLNKIEIKQLGQA